MKIAYLLNSYPRTSTTFIRREIEAIEALGQPVVRFAVRDWETALVDPEDIAEQGRTEYLLTGHVPHLLLAALTEPFVNLPRLLGVLPLWWRVYRAAGWSTIVRHIGYLFEAIRFRRRTRALGIAHVHVHFSTNATTVAMLAHALGGPGYSFTVHGPDELIDPAALALGLKADHADFVAAITDYCRRRILEHMPDPGKIDVIACGLRLADFVPSAPAPEAALRIVCVGRLCANKAQVLIPAAIAQIRDEFPDLLVELVGDGEDRDAIEAEVRRLGIERNIRLLGWRTNEEVRDHLRDSAALLLPSFAEGLPIVIMEALALERPVLTTTIAGIPELVDGGCGWIFAPGEVDRIAQAMRAVLAMPADHRLALGREGRRRIEERHDIAQSAARLIARFREAILRASPK